MTSLRDLKVLIIDCQATHADPSKGHLLEIAWAVTSASSAMSLDRGNLKSFLLDVPWHNIPPQVTRIMGIKTEDLQKSSSPAQVWHALENETARITSRQKLYAIIHFARFEMPHLRHLCKQMTGRKTLPFQVLCSHQIVLRLLPGLPRKGLRAVAGYFGHSIREVRRSPDHVLATAYIWKKIVQEIEQVEKITTVEGLQTWLQSTSIPKSSIRKYPMDPSQRLSLPDEPGVYRMLRSNGDLLYIGKASSLRRRVNSYFQKHRHTAEHILEMLAQARKLDFTTTPTSLEAALLEADEIDSFSPPYNKALRKRDRNFVFTSRGFDGLVDKPSESHCLGPLPKKIVKPLSDILLLAASGKEMTSDFFEEWPLFASPGSIPDPPSIRSGWNLFKERYAYNLANPSSSLFQLGAELWMSTRLAAETSEEDDPAEEESSWTPERICQLFENRLMTAVYWARRIRWFGLLSNSSVAWKPRRCQGGSRALLVLKSGLVVERGSLPEGADLPVPPNHRISNAQRMLRLNSTNIARLSVLTTELRRLTNAERDLSIRLSPRLALRGKRLSGLLSWI